MPEVDPRAAVLEPEKKAYPVCDMTPQRFQDRFEFYTNQPQQVSGVWTLYDAIRALPGGEEVLREDASWARKYSEKQEPAKPAEPEKPKFSNPLELRWQNQNDNLSGTGARECFSSSMAMIAMYWEKVENDDEYNRIRARYGDTTNASAQLQALKALGLKPTYIQNGTTAILKQEIDAGRPVGVGWLHRGRVSSPSGGGHWSVVSGYGSTYWVMEDPNGEADLTNGGYTPIWNGHQRRYSFRNWNPRWLLNGEGDGWAMLVRP